MLRCIIEIVPYGDEARTRHIQTLEIARTTLYDNPEDYQVSVFAADGELVNCFWVTQHLRSGGAALLASRALAYLG